MFIIDLSDHGTKKRNPVRNVRIGSGVLAATLGEEGLAREAVWWGLDVQKQIGRTDIFSPDWTPDCYTDRFAEPVFTPDLARCAIHGYAPGSGSVEFHNVILVAPGVSFEQGHHLYFAEEYGEQDLEILAITPEGRWLLAGHGEGWISRVDLREMNFGNPDSTPDAEPLTLAQEGEEWDPSAFAISPDGKRFAAGGGDGQFQLFNFEDWKKLAAFHIPNVTNAIRELTFSPNGRWVAARIAGRVVVIDLALRAVVADLGIGDITGAAFHPDGTQILTGGLDGQVRVWETSRWREVGRYDWEIGAVRAVTFDPHGLTAAAGGEDGQVVVWDFGE